MTVPHKSKALKRAVIAVVVCGIILSAIEFELSSRKCGPNGIIEYLQKITQTKCDEPLTEIPAEFLICQSDSDCTGVLGYCAWEPTNKSSEAAASSIIQQKYHLDRIEYDCPQIFKDAPKPIAKCISQRCVIPEVKK